MDWLNITSNSLECKHCLWKKQRVLFRRLKSKLTWSSFGCSWVQWTCWCSLINSVKTLFTNNSTQKLSTENEARFTIFDIVTSLTRFFTQDSNNVCLHFRNNTTYVLTIWLTRRYWDDDKVKLVIQRPYSTH